uniref:Follistatin n=1 Tax=Schmidtea mediterranea TaxID=79327 RepID=I1ZI69_SCHMD|nr:follistatin [Schmidtea mediterranea]AGC30580.1 follistatin [Schmidtea mediterranea]
MKMFITLSLLLLSVVCNLASSTTIGSLKIGACFLEKSTRGCSEFIGYMNRNKCCHYNGFFVREPNAGQLFLAAFLKKHIIPNCESSCSKDFCADKICPVGEFCIMRDEDSICSSECICSEEQKSSGPVCTATGRRYKNKCELHLESCWTNSQQNIIPCAKFGCERLNCHKRNKKCILTLNGQSKCVNKKICIGQLYDPICGVDNVTYSSRCHLEESSIRQAKEIQIAYSGVCRADANCMNVECQESDMTCITHHRNGSPVCIKCPTSMRQCENGIYKTVELLCLSTNYETKNTCYKDFLSCQNNVFIEVLYSGQCLLNAKWPR